MRAEHDRGADQPQTTFLKKLIPLPLPFRMAIVDDVAAQMYCDQSYVVAHQTSLFVGQCFGKLFLFAHAFAPKLPPLDLADNLTNT